MSKAQTVMSDTSPGGGGTTVARSAEEALRRFHDEDELGRVYDLRMVLDLWPLLRPQRAYLLGSLLLLLLMAVFGLARPLVMREALEGFQQVGGQERLTQFGLLLAGLIVLEALLSFPQMYWMQIAGARAMAALRRRVFSFLHGRKLAFFDRTPIGRLVTRVVNDVDAVGEMFSSGALNAVGDLVRLVAIVAIMASLNWKMSLFAFAAVPPVALLVNWTRRRMRTAYREVRTKTARMNAYLNEQVSGIAVVQAYARERQSARAFDQINYAYRAANTTGIVLDATLDATIEMVGSICIAAVLWYAGGRELAEVIDFATLFAFVAYIDMFFLPVRNLSARYTQVQSALAGSERIFQLLGSGAADAGDEEDAEHELARDSWPGKESTAFALHDVTFSYTAGTPVLEEICLEARRGETIALVGPTGSGKTTVASLLLRLYEVQQGRVEVFGREVSSLSRRQLRRQFAVVPQDVFLFPGTVASNVAAAVGEPDRERVRAVFDRMGVIDLFERRDGGIDTVVQERGSNFSAGERQLIAFARALYEDPPIVLLDEPTANIDSDTEARLQRAMDVATQGRTALIIAHRLSTIRGADRIVCLHQGRIAEQGSHDELVAANGIYAKMHALQVARRAIADKMEEVTSSRPSQR